MNPKAVTIARYWIPLFYLVGAAGVLWTPSRALFIRLIPGALLMNAVILLLFHSWRNSKKELIAFATIFLGGMTTEIIGVKTGMLFGSYSYGTSLGFKIFGVPPVIGINWLVLVYAVAGIFFVFRRSPVLSLILPAGLLVVYDLLLEAMAPELQMWHWQSGGIPIKNYFDWFLLSLIFLGILRIFKVNVRNPLSATVFVSQFAFFLILILLGL